MWSTKIPIFRFSRTSALNGPMIQRSRTSSLIRAHSTDVEVLILSATACADSGEPGAALAALRDAQRVAPTRADIHQRIGDVARSLGDADGAIEAYRRALELDHDFAVVRYQLARL